MSAGRVIAASSSSRSSSPAPATSESRNIGRSRSTSRLPGGAGHGTGSSCRLDDEGRHSFRFYHPVTRISLEVSRFPKGPEVKVGSFTAEVGETLPEQTIVLK